MGKDRYQKIKFYIIVLTFLYCVPFHIMSMIYSIDLKENNTLSQETLVIYNKIISQPNVIWGGISIVDKEILLQSDTIQIELDDTIIVVYAIYKNSEINYRYIHYSSFDKNANIYLSVYDNSIVAEINTKSGAYKMFSISENELSIVKLELKYIEEEPVYIDNQSEVDEQLAENSELSSVMPTSLPVIRVLFLYTDSAMNLIKKESLYTWMSDKDKVRLLAFNYINKGNESFSNSKVNAHLEIAYIGHTTFNESSHTWSNVLKYFYKNGDGYMDEVHTLRNKYKADVCVLLVNKTDYCGEAKEIKADASTAFCLIWPSDDFCNWRFSAIHEIGHLIGCRHNRSADNSNSPYKYGHGYMYCNETTSSASWCTIMSYESTCSANSKRILYWSNPDTTYNGIATGTTTYENNARVWNERAGTVSAFRTKDNSIALTANDNNSSALFESYEASTSITTSSGYQVQAEQTVDMAAGNIIRLTSGTLIKIGSKFRASIRNNADNSPYPQFVIRKDTNDNRLQRQTNFSIIPNPVNDILTIVTEEEINNAVIYNLTGIQLLLSNSKYINVSSLPQGVYVISVVTKGNGTYQSKFVKQ